MILNFAVPSVGTVLSPDGSTVLLEAVGIPIDDPVGQGVLDLGLDPLVRLYIPKDIADQLGLVITTNPTPTPAPQEADQ